MMHEGMTSQLIDPLFTILWGVIGGAALILEIIALRRKKRGDTLSEQIWALLRKSPVVWFVGLGFFSWLIVHFFAFGIVDRWLIGL